MQSAYKKHYSAKTSLLLVHNYILKSLDDSKFTVLLDLDLSAAFDTVDHEYFAAETLESLGNL